MSAGKTRRHACRDDFLSVGTLIRMGVNQLQQH
jgi:hypothetical protein